MQVALRKESVDRNTENAVLFLMTAGSLSARRAWIEMQIPVFGGGGNGSLSARRAWIEINSFRVLRGASAVALRKESVDRNQNHAAQLDPVCESLSARRAWIEIPVLQIYWLLALSLSARRAWIEIV